MSEDKNDDVVDGAAEVRAGEELNLDALNDYFAEHAPQWTGDLEVEQFPSGFSNLTYLLRKGDTELVLRRPPFGAAVKSGHDMQREHRVLSGLSGVYKPAPKPLLLCTDHEVLGADFYVMERRHGVIVRRELPQCMRGDAELFRRMCGTLVDGLADLHAVDVDVAGLSELSRGDGYVKRQVEGWMRRLERAKTSEVPELDAVGAWLVEHMPPDNEHTLVHNDYKFDNVMLDPDDPTRIVAVLDWEMCTVGDPLMDLGTTLGYWVQADDDPAWRAMGLSPTTAKGALTRQEAAERYAERTGRDVSNMLYYYCFALLKIGTIVQQIFYRFAKGHTQDPRFAQLDQVVAGLGRMAAAAADRGRY